MAVNPFGGPAVSDKNAQILNEDYNARPPASGSLEGSMNGTSSGSSSPPAPSTSDRTLPSNTQPGSIAALQSVLKAVSRTSFDQGPKPADILMQYANGGLPLTTPSAIGGAISMDTSSRAAKIGDIYNSTISLINEQEKRRQEQEQQNADWAKTLMSTMPKSVLGSMSGAEFEQLKKGVIADTLIPKIQQAIANDKNADNKFEFKTMKDANGNEVPIVFNPQTGTYTGGGGGGNTRADRNNNPLNIKFSSTTSTYNGVTGTDPNPASDGGKFLTFTSPEAGFAAAERLWKEGKAYQGVSVAKALQNWSGGGYGADVAQAAGIDPTVSAQSLNGTQLHTLFQAMAQREGWSGANKPPASFEDYLSQKQNEAQMSFGPQKVAQLKQEYQQLIGTQASQQQDVAVVKSAFAALTPRLTEDKRKAANNLITSYLANNDIQSAKEAVVSTAISTLPTDQQNQAFGRNQAIDSLRTIQGLIDQYKSTGGNMNLLAGTAEQVEQKLGNTGNAALANIGNQIRLAVVAYRHAVSGAAFTESEKKDYDNLFPSTKNNYSLNTVKIDSLLSVFQSNQASMLKTVLGEKNFQSLIATNQASKPPLSSFVQQDSPISQFVR